MNGRLVYTLTANDVGKGIVMAPPCGCPFCGNRQHAISLSGWFGLVQAGDVGKRIYSVNGIYQVENEAQRNARLAKGGNV